MAIRIEHRIGIAAPARRIWSILAELDAWSEWNPYNPEIIGRLSIGGTLEVVEALEGEAPRRGQVTVPEWTPDSQLIWREKRGFLARSMRYFEIEPLSETGCIAANGEIFEGWRGEDWAAARRARLRAAYEAVNLALKARAEA